MPIIYKSWTIEDTKSYGAKFKALCLANFGYEGKLTEKKIYEIKIEKPILPMSPLCSFENDKGQISWAHLSRFEKL